MSIWKLFGRAADPGHDEQDTAAVRRIVAALDRLEPERARSIAAFAYILGRVANADSRITPEESAQMERIVREKLGLPEEQAVLVVQIAKSQNVLFGGTENFLVTREFARGATPEQKVALLESLFAVSASEGGISTLEDNEIRRVADELGLEHRDFIAARLAYRDHLNVLRGGPA
ncbi:MAG: TerB family tellurite resistance protein [Acidobacteria bacterium]|nr:TerB family tellurite resistance protein [Acidobacteriota bacterium]